MTKFLTYDPVTGKPVSRTAPSGIRSYGRVKIAQGGGVPASDGGIDQAANDAGRFIIDNLDDYQDTLMNLNVFDDSDQNDLNEVREGIEMGATRAIIAANVNATGPLGNGNSEAHIYDIESAEVQQPHRVWGLNHMFSRLRDTRYYELRSPTIGNGDNGQLTAAWAATHGAAGFPLPSFDIDLFWTTKNRRSLYDFPKWSQGYVEPTDPGSRMAVNGGAVVAAPTGQYAYAGPPAFLGCDHDGNLLGVVGGQGNSMEALNQIHQSILKEFGSWVAAIPVANGANRAIVIKPVGVDTFFLPFLEDDIEAEAVGGSRNQHTQRIKRLVAFADHEEIGLAHRLHLRFGCGDILDSEGATGGCGADALAAACAAPKEPWACLHIFGGRPCAIDHIIDFLDARESHAGNISASSHMVPFPAPGGPNNIMFNMGSLIMYNSSKFLPISL